ncbi:MAG: DNA repair protein RecN [Rickettsiales bacterium]|jgi:DNA repair protein RecN (Recombination protein N)|nr:DNA repair protein RecN [Rickettsiales bacterium]
MLTGLVIKNFVLIEDIELSFAHRLSVLTGETGAGKSILLDAVSFVLGARADSGLVGRAGESASVAATFEVGPENPAKRILDENGIGGPSVVIRRSVSKDGKSRIFMNDIPVGAALAKSVGECLVEIHGQFDNQKLLDPSTHLAVLDGFGRLDCAPVAAAYKAWQDALGEHNLAKENFARAKLDEDYLRHNLVEMEEFGPKEGEEDGLDAKRRSLMDSERVMTAYSDALSRLSRFGDDPSLFVSEAARIVERAGAKAVADELASAASNLMDAVERLRDLVEKGGADDIDSVTDRLFKLRELARKHRVRPDELPSVLRSLRSTVGNISNSDEALKKLAEAEEMAGAKYAGLAASLSERRRAVAADLERKVMAELAPLKLDKAVFRVKIEQKAASAGGVDDVCFVGSMNAGAREGLLHKIASGGELARLTLALKVVTMDGNSADTMIFDEVDSGISGATAAAVGERLSRLGSRLQTLVVTHSPQVAACTDQHYKVVKSYDEASGKTVTSVEQLASRGRVLEIARIISSDRITPEAVSAAESLINSRKVK